MHQALLHDPWAHQQVVAIAKTALADEPGGNRVRDEYDDARDGVDGLTGWINDTLIPAVQAIAGAVAAVIEALGKVIAFLGELAEELQEEQEGEEAGSQAPLAQGSPTQVPPLAARNTPVPQPTQFPAPTTRSVSVPFLAPGEAFSRTDSLRAPADQNVYTYTVRQQEWLEVHAVPGTARSIDMVVTRPDGTRVSAFGGGGDGCYERTLPFSLSIGGLWTGGNGTYTVAVVSGCENDMALGAYTISFKSCSFPNQQIYRECQTP
jgi:hypothetical protein